MRLSRFWATALVGISVFGGIVFTTPRRALAQESGLSDAKDRARAAPASAEASLSYGRALRRAGHDDEALAELRRGRIFAKDAVAIGVDWEIARTHIAKRDFFAAMSACAGIKKLPDGAAASHVCAAEAHLLWRRGTEAIAELAEASKSKVIAPDVQYFIRVAEGRCRELDSKESDAETSYREAIRLAPNRSDAHVLLGAMLTRIGRDGGGELRRAVELEPSDPVAEYELGRARLASPASSSSAIAALERAVAERPTYVDALRTLTEAYLASNRMPDAKRTAASVLRLAPHDVLAHVVSGRVALADGKLDQALKEGQAALKLLPNDSRAELLVADAYARQGERSIDLAVEAYQKASGLDPQNPTPLIRAAYACIAANRLTSAKAFGKRAVTDFPEDAGAWLAQGDALAADGSAAAARSSYESARKARGANPAVIDGKIARLK